MSKKQLTFISITLFFLFFSACKSKKGIFRNLGRAKKTEEKIVSFVRDSVLQDPEYTYLSFKLHTKFESNGKKMPIKSTVRLYKDSLIWVSITPLLGIEMARVLVRKDSAFILNRMQSELTVLSTEQTLQQTGNIQDLSIFFDVLLGGALLKDSLLEPDHIEQKLDSLFLKKNLIYPDITTQIPTNYTYETLISMSNALLKEQRIQKQDNTQFIDIKYNDFEKVSFENGTFSIPFKQSFHIFDKDDIRIENEYSKMDTAQCRFPFNIPKNYKIISY